VELHLDSINYVKLFLRNPLARCDRQRKKRMSNKEWKSPSDEDARIAKMKDGRMHLAHKAEHAVDLDTGAVVVAAPVVERVKRVMKYRGYIPEENQQEGHRHWQGRGTTGGLPESTGAKRVGKSLLGDEESWWNGALPTAN
jgi:hypothetical protein